MSIKVVLCLLCLFIAQLLGLPSSRAKAPHQLVLVMKNSIQSDQFCRIDFSRRYQSELMGLEKLTQGSIRLYKNRFNLTQEAEDQTRTEIIFDGNVFWLLDFEDVRKNGRPQQITRAKNAPLAHFFRSLFSAERLEKTFNISLKESNKETIYALEPKKQAPFAFKNITVAVLENKLSSIELVDDIQNRNRFQIMGMTCAKWNKSYRSFFQFAPLKTEKVIEL